MTTKEYKDHDTYVRKFGENSIQEAYTPITYSIFTNPNEIPAKMGTAIGQLDEDGKLNINEKTIKSLNFQQMTKNVDGKIVKTGRQELATEIEENGYAQYK